MTQLAGLAKRKTGRWPVFFCGPGWPNDKVRILILALWKNSRPRKKIAVIKSASLKKANLPKGRDAKLPVYG